MIYQRCTRCVMDNASDDTIFFDEEGICNYCTQAYLKKKTTYFPNEEGERRLNEIIKNIKQRNEGKEYDCVMGISGGLDSSYLAYLGTAKWGLRILAVHIDDGFDTEISKTNISKLVKATNIDLKIIKPDEEQYCALIKAYMLAGVPNLAVPQDNILFAFLYDVVKKNGIKFFLSGGNFALESILQHGNTYNAMDTMNIRAINKKFGTKPINNLKFISSYRKYFDMKFAGLQTFRLLDLIDYNRDRAFEELKAYCGFEYYGRKHLENILTAFVQLYWLPQKFGVDKRTSHLSSMIVSGQMTREEALKELSEPLYDKKMMDEYIDVIKEKLHFSDDEFKQVMKAVIHQHNDYDVDRLAGLIHRIISRIRGY